MENVLLIGGLIQARTELERDIHLLKEHLNFIEKDEEGHEKFSVQINTRWTDAVTFDHKKNPSFAKHLIQYSVDELESKLKEIESSLWQFDKIITDATK